MNFSLSTKQERVIHYTLCFMTTFTFWYLTRETKIAIALFLFFWVLTYLHERITDIHDKLECKKRLISSYVPNHFFSIVGAFTVWYVFDSLHWGIATWLFFVILTCMKSLITNVTKGVTKLKEEKQALEDALLQQQQ